jgi:hypothetical protein
MRDDMCFWPIIVGLEGAGWATDPIIMGTGLTTEHGTFTIRTVVLYKIWTEQSHYLFQIPRSKAEEWSGCEYAAIIG